MKVMLILASSGPTVGGMELQAAQQAEALNSISSTEVCMIASPCFDKIISAETTHVPIDMSRSRRNIFLLKDLFNSIKNYAPDIIHAHGHKSATLLATLKPFLPNTVKLVATAHNVKRNNKCLTKMDDVFVVSQGIANKIAPIKSQVVLNGIKAHKPGKLTKESFCNHLNLDAKLPLIIGVGRLVETKRFEYLLRAAEGLNANIVICGNGPELHKLQQIAPLNCLLTGYRSDIRDILFVADFMVISADRDGFSLALIEALHSGLPVLSTPVPGAEDLLPESSLIRSTDKQQFHHFLESHLNNLDFLRHSQKEMFEFVRNELHITQVAERTRTLYSTLLAK